MRFVIIQGEDGRYRWILRNDYTGRDEAVPCGPGFETSDEAMQSAFNIIDSIREGGDVYYEDGSPCYR